MLSKEQLAKQYMNLAKNKKRPSKSQGDSLRQLQMKQQMESQMAQLPYQPMPMPIPSSQRPDLPYTTMPIPQQTALPYTTMPYNQMDRQQMLTQQFQKLRNLGY